MRVGGGPACSAGCVGGSKGLSAEDKEKLKAVHPRRAAGGHAAQARRQLREQGPPHRLQVRPRDGQARAGGEDHLLLALRRHARRRAGCSSRTPRTRAAARWATSTSSGPLREQRNGNHQVLGPERWEKGKVYVDEQTYKVPDDVTGAEITVYTGIWKGDARLRIISGPNDGDNSAIVGKIKTGVAAEAGRRAHAERRPDADA